jgi:hypothetical protein
MSKTFFTVVLSITLLHLVVVTLITILFGLRGRNLTLGDSWSFVAQLWSPETEMWLEKADGVKDSVSY